jgi:hypothetical protein
MMGRSRGKHALETLRRSHKVNPLKPSGYCMYHQVKQSVHRPGQAVRLPGG